jgi:signal-transduction protein with cAMP-binding, CBS, and nucleotidyltransferase domain
MSDQLSKHIIKLVPSLEGEIEEIMSFFELEYFEERAQILEEGHNVSKYYFVNKGCLHLYFNDVYQNQNTIFYALKRWWITEYHAFLDNSKAEFGISAIEPSEVLSITKSNFEKLLVNHPLMGIYFNTIHMRAYAEAVFN